VLVILRPGLAAFNPAAILVLLAAFGYGIVMVTTKKLTATESTFGIIFWMSVIQFPLSLLGSDITAYANGVADPPALAVGLAGLTSHYCLANAFRVGDATLVVPLDFMRIPLIAVVGWAFYGEQLDIFVLLGAGIIVAGVLWNLRAESTRGRPKAT
jgi:drug/metabolite transporter (DMT)-like permease